MRNKGILTVISGFSGAGKGTVVKQLIKNEQYALSISATTRQPRVSEIHGQEYFFIEKEEFEAKIKKDAFFEYAQYCNNYYGTPKEFVLGQMEKGKDVILEIEAQGALKVKQAFPEAVLIFIITPTVEELKRRLIGRGTETAEVIEKRLQRAEEEIDLMHQYDYVLENREVEQCAEDIHQIIQVEHNRMIRNNEITHLLKDEFDNISFI